MHDSARPHRLRRLRGTLQTATGGGRVFVAGGGTESAGGYTVVCFFFKQKTAYDIGLGIPAEPLFRSGAGDERREERGRRGRRHRRRVTRARSEERRVRKSVDLGGRRIIKKKHTHPPAQALLASRHRYPPAHSPLLSPLP